MVLIFWLLELCWLYFLFIFVGVDQAGLYKGIELDPTYDIEMLVLTGVTGFLGKVCLLYHADHPNPALRNRSLVDLRGLTRDV